MKLIFFMIINFLKLIQFAVVIISIGSANAQNKEFKFASINGMYSFEITKDDIQDLNELDVGTYDYVSYQMDTYIDGDFFTIKEESNIITKEIKDVFYKMEYGIIFFHTIQVVNNVNDTIFFNPVVIKLQKKKLNEILTGKCNNIQANVNGKIGGEIEKKELVDVKEIFILSNKLGYKLISYDFYAYIDRYAGWPIHITTNEITREVNLIIRKIRKGNLIYFFNIVAQNEKLDRVVLNPICLKVKL